MNQSRTKHYRPGRLPRQRRTIRIFGAVSYIDGRAVQDQSNKLFRCWNCGFVCNTDRDKLGDGIGYYITDRAEVKPTDLAATSIKHPQGDGQRAVNLSFDTVSTPCLMRLDSEGNPVVVVHCNTQIVTSGCPLCGCENYK